MGNNLIMTLHNIKISDNFILNGNKMTCIEKGVLNNGSGIGYLKAIRIDGFQYSVLSYNFNQDVILIK